MTTITLRSPQPARPHHDGAATHAGPIIEDRIFKHPFFLAYGARARPSTRVCRSLKVAQDG